MAWRSVPIVGGAYTDDTKPWQAQDLLNWIPEKGSEDGRSVAMLRGAPGEYQVADLGARIRGMYVAEDRLFVTAGTTQYEVRANRSYLGLGTIPGLKRTDSTHNQLDGGGNHVVTCNGHDAYVYNTLTAGFAKITDSAFLGAKKLGFLGHYVLALDPLGRGWQHSDLKDAHSWLATDSYEAETAPDKIRSFIVDHGQALFLGDRTSEWFANEPLSANEAFQNTKTSFPRGCAATYSVVSLDNTVYWLGNDGIVYRLAGMAQPQRVSTHALEQAFRRCDMSQAFAFAYEDAGHAIYYLTFPDGQTWGYDVSTGLWHRRASPGMERWRINALVKWDGRWYGGDFASGKVYTLDWDYAQTEADPLVRRRVPGPLYRAGNKFTNAGVRLGVAVRESRVPDVEPWWEAIVIGNPMADGFTNDVVDHQYTVSGGTAPYTWSIVGSLPTGVTNAGTGHLTGWMGELGTHAWTVKVTDANGRIGTLVESVKFAGYPFVAQLSESGATATRIHRTLYGLYNRYDASHQTVATFDKTSGYAAVGNPGVIVDGYLISRVEFDNDSASGSQVSGLYSLKFTGAALTQQSRWQISTATGHDYLDHVLWDDDTLIAFALDGSDSSDGKLYVLRVTAGNFTLLDTLEIDTDTAPRVALTVHGTGDDKVCVAWSYHATEGRRFVKAYSVDDDGQIAQVGNAYAGSMASPISITTHTDTIVSDGEYLYLPSGQILTWDGADFALADSFTPTTNCVGLSVWKETENDDLRHIRWLDSSALLAVWSWDGVNAVSLDSEAGQFSLMGRTDTLQDDDTDSAVRARQGEWMVPCTDFIVATEDNGVWTGAPYSRAEDLGLDYDNNANPFRASFRFLESELTER